MGHITNPITLRARELRQTATTAEICLWNALKNRQLGDYKFTRQYPVGSYFADFACRQRYLLIELDGAQHFENEYDQRRDAYLLDEGYSILRIPSADVLKNRDQVCATILATLEGRIEDFVNAHDLKFTRSFAVPRRMMRRHFALQNSP
jgi:very-short-patch-repair endonuclease